jgi:hypothetical protein
VTTEEIDNLHILISKINENLFKNQQQKKNKTEEKNHQKSRENFLFVYIFHRLLENEEAKEKPFDHFQQQKKSVQSPKDGDDFIYSAAAV